MSSALPIKADELAIFVVAGHPQTGKTEVAIAIGELLGTPAVSSSAVINGRVERRLRLPAGRIEQVRRRNPDHYRADLIAEGDAMTRAGQAPGVLCVEAGFHVIDGIRRKSELAASIAAAEQRGLRSVVIFVERSSSLNSNPDNSEGQALRAAADMIVYNDSDLNHLRDQIVKDLTAYLD
jgi:dephospho-CoA kinase